MAGLAAISPLTSGGQTDSPAEETKSGSLMRDYRDSIVLINGKNGAGSGFIFTRAGRRFLVSNAHVFAGIKSPTFAPLDRSTLRFKPGPALLAVGEDLMMLELQPGTNGIPLVENFEQTVHMNAPVVVYGNTSGEDVATAIEGRVVGIGTDRLEIDAGIEHGNSGSPIIHVPSGKAIGVVTYAKRDNLLSGEKKVRRFGYRLDTVKQWEPVDWTKFYAEADALKNMSDTTVEMKRAFLELSTMPQREKKARQYSYETDALREALDDFYSGIRRPASRDAVERTADDLVENIRQVSRSHPASLNPTFMYDYFRTKLNEQERDRAEIMKLFVKTLQK